MTAFELAAMLTASAACITDIRAGRIPNVLTFGALLIGLVAQSVAPAGAGGAAALGGAFAGVLVFFPVFALGGMGAGDVKLMGALGAWLGWSPALYTALYAAVAGGVLAVAVAWRHGYLWRAFQNVLALLSFWRVEGVRPFPPLTLDEGRGPRLPYAVPILLGLSVTIWRH